MVDIESCIALSGLTEEEVEAIATHAHIPAMVAVGLGSCLIELVRLPDGQECICANLAEHIRAAQERGDLAETAKFKLVLRHLLKHHAPQAA